MPRSAKATISFTDTLELSVGVRYHEENVFTEQRAFINGVTAPRPTSRTGTSAATRSPARRSRAGARLAGRVHLRQGHEPLSLQKTFSDNVMGYVSYAEGFNSGGVATPTIQGVRALLPYKPQTIETFEIGIRRI